MGTLLPLPSLARRRSMQIGYSPKLQSNAWVKLLQKTSPNSFDRALLLYQVSCDEWLAWIPGYGEACLNTKQFYPLG
ncbi:hypothetical protein [Altericista sp. CCNU0014]|uniref:hypothetical protein n=1 Tax=Altericista sp. CCNU0014 TaxID=3082949 RepID=UPI00385069CB